MKERTALIALCLFAGVLTWFFQQDPSIESVDTPTESPVPVNPVRFTSSEPVVYPEATPPPVNPRAPGRPALTPPERASLRPVPPHPDAVSIGGGSFTPEQEIQVLAGLFRLYREQIGSLPVGENNRQIMNALRGNNPDRQGWFPYEHSRLTEQGDLQDPWGTPYFFHALSSRQMEIRSAGPDQTLYTKDDLLHSDAATPERN